MIAYYNESDPYCVAWLRALIAEGLIADGDVDGRDIREVRPGDLRAYSQVHLFAGIGGWSYALRLAGWPDNRPAWTGSCPCQPFSTAGKRLGTDDPRHLWPEFRRLVYELNPPVVFGEQVAAAKVWLDAVLIDLEAFHYACGAAILPAAGVGAPHRRDRMWFVADANSNRLRQQQGRRKWTGWEGSPVAPDNGAQGPVAHTNGLTRNQGRQGDAAQGERGGNIDRGGKQSRAVGVAHSSRLAIGQGIDGNACSQQPPPVGAGWWATEPDVGRVAHGIPARVAKLRALGNAIVPQVAATFISAYREAVA